MLILGCSVNICCRLQSLGEEGRQTQMNVLGGLRNENMKFAFPESCVPAELSKLFYEQDS